MGKAHTCTVTSGVLLVRGVYRGVFFFSKDELEHTYFESNIIYIYLSHTTDILPHKNLIL